MSRFLVAYGTKHGATAEIAERIGEELRAQGHEATVAAAGEVGELDGFDAIVLGSAVYTRRWRRDASRLLKRLRRELDGRPLWVFSSGPLGDTDPDPSDKWQFPPRIREAGDRLGARDQVVFGGRVPLEPRNFAERAMVRNTPAEERDARDFDAIAAWARSIAAALSAG